MQTAGRIPRAKARAILPNFLPGLKARASTLKPKPGLTQKPESPHRL